MTDAQISDPTAASAWGLGSLALLVSALECSSGSRDRRRLLVEALASAPPRDAAWLLRLLSGERLRQLMPSTALRLAIQQASGYPEWLVEESYQTVGDLAETAALLVPETVLEPRATHSLGLADWIEQRLMPLQGAGRDAVSEALQAWWRDLLSPERFCLNKLVTGGFRVGVSRGLVAQALADWTGREAPDMAQRLLRFLAAPPSAEAMAALCTQKEGPAGPEPVPFFLSQSFQGLEADLDAQLGPASDWLLEWKWDGIRAQLILGHACPARLWSRGEEPIEESFPELLIRLAPDQPEALLDGEILVWQPGSPSPQPFADLQARLGRRRPSASLQRRLPAVLMAYDLLWLAGEDLRGRPFVERRRLLDIWLRDAHFRQPVSFPIRVSPLLSVEDWPQAGRLRQQAEQVPAEGLMIKRRLGLYGQGRTRLAPGGESWKWKRDPYQVDAVLITAQRGHGRRAGLYTDYGFAVWDDRQSPPVLVPFAKAYSGLTDAEIRWVDRRVRETIEEQFGPVRQVRPTLVVELGFEGISRSSRHRSGLAVRFPRILRLRLDKPVEEADRISQLERHLP